MDEKKFEEVLKSAKKMYEQSLKAGEIVKNSGNARFKSFFLKLSEKSLITAGILYDLSNNEAKKAQMGIDKTYDGNMWAVISSFIPCSTWLRH